MRLPPWMVAVGLTLILLNEDRSPVRSLRSDLEMAQGQLQTQKARQDTLAGEHRDMILQNIDESKKEETLGDNMYHMGYEMGLLRGQNAANEGRNAYLEEIKKRYPEMYKKVVEDFEMATAPNLAAQ
jgi:hypothetical protein